MVGVVEQTVTLEPEAGEYFRAVAAAVQANLMVVLLDSGCSHHLMGTKEAFVDNAPSGDVKHVRGFNEALQTVEGRGIVALQGEAGKQVLILDMLYVPGVQANLLSAGQLKENGVLLQDDGNEMMLVNATGQVLIDRGGGSADDCIGNEVDAAQVAREACKRWHRHIKSSAKHNVATGLDIKPLTGTNLHSGHRAHRPVRPFRVAAKDGSYYFLLLKDCKTRYEWVRPIVKKSDVLHVFEQWLMVVERQTKKSVMMLRSDRGGEFLGKDFTNRSITSVASWSAVTNSEAWQSSEGSNSVRFRYRPEQQQWRLTSLLVVKGFMQVYGANYDETYADKLRRHFIDEEQTGRIPKTPVTVDAYAELTSDGEDAQGRLAAVCGDDDEAGHRLRVRQAGKRPDGADGGPEMMCLVGYVDADDASDKQNQMSTGGNVFVFEGAAVSWSSQRIKCATLSSTESEYVAATKASKEGRQLRFLLAEFQQLDAGTPMMVKRGKFVLRYIRTTEQPAAFMTKVLHFPAFNRCSVAIGQLRLADVGDGDDDVQQ
ncbi:unnamed protein product [Closterium sp. NIES-53]